MLVSSEKMLADARRNHYAIPAPDFWDSRSVSTFVKTAESLNAPLILSFAQIHLSYLGLEEAALLGKFHAKKCASPVALHLDHGTDLSVIEEAIRLGFTSVMIDASEDPYEENVRKTKEAVKMAHAAGVSVEAEIGHVGVNPGDIRGAQESVYTEVPDAVRFTEATGIDSLAVSIGTSHGLYKGTPVIGFERLKELAAAVPVPLVLHGGSSSGDENLSRCAANGISKINLYTDFIVAAKKAAGGIFLAESEGGHAPSPWPDILKESGDAAETVLRRYYKVFHLA